MPVVPWEGKGRLQADIFRANVFLQPGDEFGADATTSAGKLDQENFATLNQAQSKMVVSRVGDENAINVLHSECIPHLIAVGVYCYGEHLPCYQFRYHELLDWSTGVGAASKQASAVPLSRSQLNITPKIWPGGTPYLSQRLLIPAQGVLAQPSETCRPTNW